MEKRRLDDYRIVRTIGRGLTGKVILAWDLRHHPSPRLCALKAIAKGQLTTPLDTTHVWDERRCLLGHPQSPFLISLYAAFQTSTHLYFALEYHPGGDFASILANVGRLSEAQSRFYAGEILMGLRALHRGGIIYRDLKPENVLLDKRGHVVLTDFGLSKPDAQDLLLRTFCGTAEYLAPEILQGRPYDFAVDLWSFGTMLYEMLVGIVPFYSPIPHEMYRKIVRDVVAFPPEAPVSAAAEDLIRRLLAKNPRERPTVDIVLQHPFFAVDWTAGERKAWDAPILPNTAASSDEALSEDSDSLHRKLSVPLSEDVRVSVAKPAKSIPHSATSTTETLHGPMLFKGFSIVSLKE